MSIYVDQIPPNAPVLVVFVAMKGCGACAEYTPIFEKVAAPYAQRGLPIFRVEVDPDVPPDPNTENFLNAHGVEAMPTVIAATLYRGPLDRIEGTATETQTRRLLDVAWAHNKPWSPW